VLAAVGALLGAQVLVFDVTLRRPLGGRIRDAPEIVPDPDPEREKS
jgi:hypothetical protein